MPKYKVHADVYFSELIIVREDIEAETEEEAREKAINLAYSNSNNDLVDVDWVVLEEIKEGE